MVIESSLVWSMINSHCFKLLSRFRKVPISSMKQLPVQGPGKSCHYQEDTNDDYACDEKEEDE